MMKTLKCLTIILPLLAAGPAAVASTKKDEAAIAKALNDGCKAVEARDVAGMIAPFEKSDSLVMFDWNTPRSRGYQQLWDANEEFKRTVVGQPFCQYLEIHPVILSRDAAYTRAILHVGGELADGRKIDLVMRSTDIWRKIRGQWKIVHEHNSFPTDMATGLADLQSKP